MLQLISFQEQLREEAKEFRKKKIQEVLQKPNQTEEEISFIKFWCKHYGTKTY